MCLSENDRFESETLRLVERSEAAKVIDRLSVLLKRQYKGLNEAAGKCVSDILTAKECVDQIMTSQPFRKKDNDKFESEKLTRLVEGTKTGGVKP